MVWCRWFCSRVAAVYHAFVCQPHAVMWSSKRWKREGGDVGLWVRKQDLVRRILACRGQPLSSANIVIRFSVRLHLSNIECRLCCCFSYWFSLHQVQHVFAIQSSCMATRKLYSLVISQNKSWAQQVQFLELGYLGSDFRLGDGGAGFALYFKWLHNAYHLLHTVMLCVHLGTEALGGFEVFFIIKI